MMRYMDTAFNAAGGWKGLELCQSPTPAHRPAFKSDNDSFLKPARCVTHAGIGVTLAAGQR
jgi:hypothetical protein